ncbi:MAG: hypothetical protein IKN24_04080 [Lachnospiraceae bacterium]|nr:hypothetical protein [Lachnospiraceae bacterium]
MANLLENAMKMQVQSNREQKQANEERATEEKIKDIVSEYVQDAVDSMPKQDPEEIRSIVAEAVKEAMSAQKTDDKALSDQIQDAINVAVREAMAGISVSTGENGNVSVTGGGDTAHIQEQVDKIYTEITAQFAKQKEMIDAIGNVSDKNKEFLTDIQTRMDKQTENSAALVAQVRQKDEALTTIDYVAIRDNITEFKDAIESCSQTMDQLRKQLNRERNNNDRTITELYRSMKYSEERVEELHSSYDEFTTVISSHKNIMGVLIWLDIIIIVALIVFNVIQLL